MTRNRGPKQALRDLGPGQLGWSCGCRGSQSMLRVGKRHHDGLQLVAQACKVVTLFSPCMPPCYMCELPLDPCSQLVREQLQPLDPCAPALSAVRSAAGAHTRSVSGQLSRLMQDHLTSFPSAYFHATPVLGASARTQRTCADGGVSQGTAPGVRKTELVIASSCTTAVCVRLRRRIRNSLCTSAKHGAHAHVAGLSGAMVVQQQARLIAESVAANLNAAIPRGVSLARTRRRPRSVPCNAAKLSRSA